MMYVTVKSHNRANLLIHQNRNEMTHYTHTHSHTYSEVLIGVLPVSASYWREKWTKYLQVREQFNKTDGVWDIWVEAVN